MRIYLLGFMGAGKTHWGKKLKSTLKLSLYDLDEEIVRGEDKSIPDIFEKHGEDYFRDLERQYLQKLSKKEDALISCGGGTPCFLDNMTFMNSRGLTVWLNVPVEVMTNRVKRGRKSRPLLKDFDDEQLQNFVAHKLEERKPFYAQAKLIVNPIKFNVKTLTNKIQSCVNLI